MKSQGPSRAGRPKGRVTALLAAALLLSVAPACSGDGGGGNGGGGKGDGSARGGSRAAGLIAASALRTQSEGSARVAMTIATAAPGAPKGFAVTGRGAVDFGGGRGRLVFQVPNVFGEDQASAARQSITTVYDGSVLYLTADFISRIVPGGKPWLAMDTGKASGSLGLLPQLSQLGQSDPIAAFGLVEGLTGPVETIDANADIRGSPTTHYRFTIDVAKALTKVAGASRAQIGALQKQGVDTIPADVWLDEAGAVRRMRYELRVPPNGGAGKAKVGISMELFDFGTPVDIKPPPSGQVTDIGQLLGPGPAGG